MKYQDDSNDPDWKVSKLKSGTVKEHHSASKPKYSQKFCEKWLNVFSPWLSRCDDDPHKPFCRACQCRLDCNRCHLQRHERTSKHARNLELLVNKGEGAARQNLSIRQERSKYYQQRKKCNDSIGSEVEDAEMEVEDYIDEAEQENDSVYEQSDVVSKDQFTQEDSNNELITDEPVEQITTTRPTSKNSVDRPPKLVKQESEQNIEEGSNMGYEELPDRQEGMKLLIQIQKEKSDLMDSFKELMGTNIPQASPAKEKNHVDLFFESVSSSVKALSPKLIAEAKMRVSQLICELELRALNEGSVVVSNHQQPTTTTMLVSPETTTSGTYILGIANAGQHHQSHDEEVQHYEALS